MNRRHGNVTTWKAELDSKISHYTSKYARSWLNMDFSFDAYSREGGITPHELPKCRNAAHAKLVSSVY
jgi:hypothetical protein